MILFIYPGFILSLVLLAIVFYSISLFLSCTVFWLLFEVGLSKGIFEELLECRAKSVGSIIVDKRIHCTGKVSGVPCDEPKPRVGLAFLLLAQYGVDNCWKIGNEISSYSYSDGLGGFDIAL